MKTNIKLIGNSGIQFYDQGANLEHPEIKNLGIDFAEIVSSSEGGQQVSLVLPEYDDSRRKFINPDTRETLFCPQCGREIKLPANFCPQCGTPVKV